MTTDRREHEHSRAVRRPATQQDSQGDGPRVVLVAAEEAEAAVRALSYAAGFARRNGARLALVHVVKPVPPATFLGAAEIVRTQTSAREEAARSLLERLAASASEFFGGEVTRVLCCGDPAREVARVADELCADALVVGGSRSWRHRLFGGVSGRLARRARCPVIVVP